MILGIDFAMGVGATLTAEFLISHAYLWYTGGGSNTVSAALTTIEADVSKVKTGVATLEQRGLAGMKSLANTVETDAKSAMTRTEAFYQSFLHSNQAAQTAPVAQTAPATPSSGGTPVPSVTL